MRVSDTKAARLAAIRTANAARRGAAEDAPAAAREISAAPASPVPQPETTREPRLAGVAPPVAEPSDMAPAISPQLLLGLLLGTVVGALAVVALPAWMPGLSASLLSAEPKAYWYLARSSALAAYGLLWLAMLFGLLMSGRLARLWPGGPTAFELHQHASLLGLALALFHALILLGDRYVTATPAQVLIPFAYSGFAPLWVGLGQLGLYGLALVGLSFYVRERIGRRAWRLVHALSFVVFALALAHGVMSGSDSEALWARALYWGSGGSVLFLTIYRVLAARAARARPARP
jgi:predicted ferric reductase